MLASTNAFGSADLDTRPPEMQRSTMGAWIERCPGCGCCAPDVATCGDEVRPVIESAAYRAQLDDPRYPGLASCFICAGMIADARGAQDEAGWHHLHAAWALDDANERELAAACRSQAADRFLAVLSAGHSIEAEPGGAEAIVTDCLRRAGRGGEALQLLDRAPTKEYADVLQKVLAFQRKRIDRGDLDCHRISEALAPR